MSKSNSIQFSVVERLDANKEAFLIGSCDIPVSMDLRDVTFLVFYPIDGSDRGTILIRPRNQNPDRRFREDPPDRD